MASGIDWKQTDRNLIRLLSQELRPIHYTEAFNRTKVWSCASYNEKTDPVEKFRQRFGEGDGEPGFDFIRGGFIALSRWFPLRHSLSLLPPQEQVIIEGNTIVSFDAGYETAKREPHMQNKFNKSPQAWYERRRRGMLVESHIANYFRINYPRFFIEPSNKGQYENPAKEDFTLKTDWTTIAVDIKSLGEDNDETFVVTRPCADVSIYIIGDLLEDKNQTIITGFTTTDIVKVLGEKQSQVNDAWIVNTRDTWSIEPLLVMLNMADCGMNYNEYKRQRKVKMLA